MGKCGVNSVGRVSASQAECRGFESRTPLHIMLRDWDMLYKIVFALLCFISFLIDAVKAVFIAIWGIDWPSIAAKNRASYQSLVDRYSNESDLNKE